MAAACLLVVFTFVSYLPIRTASAKATVPEIEFASPPVTQYKAGDRVNFNIYAPNYGGKVQYRVVLWNDTEKTYYDLWNASNGYPDRYYTKWQPYGNNIFTLGWIINEPGSYRITVYAKRAGIANNKTALKGYNCDSYMESMAFYVKSKEAAVDSILPLDDVTVMQGGTPTLPTKVKAAMSDSLIKELSVAWPTVNTSTPGTQTIEGTVEGTTRKAAIKVNVTGQTVINVYSVSATSSYLVNVTLRDALYSTPDASKFSIKSFNGSTTVPIQTVSLSSDKKTVVLATGYMTPNSWYTLTVNNNSYNFIANQGTGSNISLAAQNKEVAVGATAYASVAKYPSDVTMTYYSSNSTVATIDQNTGLITGKYPGVATITVYGYKYGYYQTSTTFTVTVGGQSGIYVYAPNMQINVGSTQTPTVTKNPSDLTITYTSSNSNIASVNYYSGLVTGVAPGTATITMTASRSGYSVYTSTFNVTVVGQGMTVIASPDRLYESANNNGSLQTGVIDLYLSGSTFYNLGYYYIENYVDILNLPYGMSYTAAYVNSNQLRVTITGAAYLHSSASDTTLSIVVRKEIVYGANYNLTATNNVVLDFSDFTIPAAPTNPNVNDSNNTFGWSNVSGYSSITNYEYTVNGGTTWNTCTANPQPVGDENYASGRVGVRVKANTVTGMNAGNILWSNTAFNKAVDISDPALSKVTYSFDGGAASEKNFTNGVVTVEINQGQKLTSLSVRVEDANLDKSDVIVYSAPSTQWGILKFDESSSLFKLETSNNYTFNTSGAITLTAIFKDTLGNDITATINLNIIPPQPTQITRTTGEIGQDPGSTGGNQLTYTFVNQVLNISGSNVPFVLANGGYLLTDGYWVGVKINRPSGAADAGEFTVDGITYQFKINGTAYQFDYVNGFYYYFKLGEGEVTEKHLDIVWGTKYTETLDIICTAAKEPNLPT